jgi:hypothetical protein
MVLLSPALSCSPKGFRHENADIHVLRRGNALNVVQRHIALAPFDQADVGAVEARCESQLVLRQARLRAQSPHKHVTPISMQATRESF